MLTKEDLEYERNERLGMIEADYPELFRHHIQKLYNLSLSAKNGGNIQEIDSNILKITGGK